MYTPIRNYAIIGNLHSSALVSLQGSIDWACVPFLHSPSIFGGLLDEKKGGSWSISPTLSFRSVQEYVPHTNILVTTFTTDTGIVELVDFIPIERKEQKEEYDPRVFKIYRKVRCTKGKMQLNFSFTPRFDYARAHTRFFETGGKIKISSEEEVAYLIPSVRLHVDDTGARKNIILSEGEEMYFLFFYEKPSDDIQNLKTRFHDAYERTYKYWVEWVKEGNEHLPILKSQTLRETVIRSSLVLKVLFFEPTGAIAAAVTTSLPEHMGGIRNWDYRFTWLRDSTFTLQALLLLNHIHEAEKYLQWIFYDIFGSIQKEGGKSLQIMYGLQGERELREEILVHLEGYRNSQPVRIGNGAYDQKQWDIYGSIFDTVWQLKRINPEYSPTSEMWKAFEKIADHVLEVWNLPDEGLWEVRGGKRHFVYSKVMCFIALMRIADLADMCNRETNQTRWREEAQKIRQTIFEKGWNEKKGAFVQSFGSEELDSSALLFSKLGFIDGKDPRMISTIEKIEKELMTEEGLVYRYKTEDGLPGEEGVFLLASFWLVDAFVLSGQKQKANDLFVKLVRYANHVGLFSEEMNPHSKEFLGNFPQAYTHIGLINSAFLLSGV